MPGKFAIPYVYPDSETYGIDIRKSLDDLKAVIAGDF